MNRARTILIAVITCISVNISAQQVYDLQSCLKFALENNHNIRKAQFDKEKSAEARHEILGALLPQISGTGNLNYNIEIEVYNAEFHK